VARKHDEAPDWFPKRDYGYLRGLNAAGWLRELERCAHLESEAAKRAAGKQSFEEEWKDILDEEIAAGCTPAYIGPPTVEVVDNANQADLYAIERPMLILQVWLGATDAEIMSAFEKELRKAREQHPSPVRKPGPQALNGIIGETEFARWQNHKIIEISELLGWGSQEGREIRNADLGRWLFEDHADPDKAAHEALNERKRAFDTIPALWSQTLRKTQSR
jgi:hypothetical protein